MAGIAGFLLAGAECILHPLRCRVIYHRQAGRIGCGSADDNGAAGLIRGRRSRVYRTEWQKPRSVTDNYGSIGRKDCRLVPKLLILILTFIVSAGVRVFEVGLALRGKQELGLSPYQIAMMFTECSLVMFVLQDIVFSPWFKPDKTRWLIVPALATLATGPALVPKASNFR